MVTVPEQFRSCAQIQGVQLMNIVPVLFCHRQHINGIPAQVNDRRPLNTELRVARDIALLVGQGNGGGAICRIQEIDLPQWQRVAAFGYFGHRTRTRCRAG